ncbi:Yip1 family protein [Phaeobacter sp. 22II1-1F12B]|uniref:Yip1 family protein n=1 Tax=Phaeobacter sp. 22II1-1F12B TaxID=1317111 RepID=UPI000B5226AE|nr:Yip1 family protein [Phaeobacter sp. 22II1-1F12B]OWU70613.1 hypothetical protein ATO1_23785 [Phaeobacter sp. 22II1-1F12B]
MNAADLQTFALRSIRDPAGAAPALMNLELPRSVLWSGIILMAALQSLLVGFAVWVTPVPNDPESPVAIIQALYGAPLWFFGVTLLISALTIYALLGMGRLFGGTGTLQDIMVVMVWFQAIQIACKLVAMVLGLFAPILEALMVLAASGIGIYMFVNFINQVHRFDSIGRTLVVIVLAMLAVLLGFSLFVVLVGTPFMGESLYV